ncbi:uncharacterized protein LOC126716462 [Quercus robur]|uniref:uncharacterized protein LOC126716462 n=1 Tax=Quercus robur TaxID=38942 RepID=UPI0021620AB0|nr:uncharacterized protein LOC126716462 [Quercus robur]
MNLAMLPLFPQSQFPDSCSFRQWINLAFPTQTDRSGMLDSVSKLALTALLIYDSNFVIRKWISRPAHTHSGDPAHSAEDCSTHKDTKFTNHCSTLEIYEIYEPALSKFTKFTNHCSTLDTKLTNQNDSAGVELTNQNAFAEGSISETLV